MRDMRKILGTIIGILAFIAVMAGLSYAIYAFLISNNSVVKGSHDCVDIQYIKGTDVNESEVDFVDSYTQTPVRTSIVFNETGNCVAKSTGTISIYTNPATSSTLISGITSDGIEHGVLKYAIVNQNNNSEIYEGYITNTGDTNIDVGLLNRTQTTYNVYLWLEADSTNTVTNETISQANYAGYIQATARQSSKYK